MGQKFAQATGMIVVAMTQDNCVKPLRIKFQNIQIVHQDRTTTTRIKEYVTILDLNPNRVPMFRLQWLHCQIPRDCWGTSPACR